MLIVVSKMPISSAALALAVTYEMDAASSPTRTTPSPGMTPFSLSLAARTLSSSRIWQDTSLPLMIFAGILSSFSAVNDAAPTIDKTAVAVKGRRLLN